MANVGCGFSTTLLGLVKLRLDELVTYPAEAFERLATEYMRVDDGDWYIDACYRALPTEGRLGAEWEEALVTPARQSYHKWTRTVTMRFTKALEVKGAYTATAVKVTEEN